MIDSLTMLPNNKGFINQCFGSSECISDTTKVIFNQERGVKKFYYTDGTTCTFCTRGYYEYAENIGKTFKHIIYPAPEGFEGGYKIESLVYAKISGAEYGAKVSVPLQDNLPTKFSLSQNYPNPFNPSTTIKYSIPSIAVIASGAKQSSKIATSSDETWTPRNDNLNITLKIYDILGREVATLVNKEQKAGNYEVQFDASNLTSGIYFYRLQSGSFVESRKMILIK
ncbi:MAG: T9SS type A sorting domain-containing protein [Bacteroidetes bacterium]|nr:T9SS type A sorting domain-containing protein [Bacteroidota bacterium]MBU1116469.1 T9SS type A sorting domain-containing protein [Bacteroidota bacterium]MBU1797296.1 T9SS type A sorting domain-containing protein [Bacteroidota bacterium]